MSVKVLLYLTNKRLEITMVKLFLLFLMIYVGNNGAANLTELDLFLKNHSKGIGLAGTALGDKNWKNLLNLYNQSGDHRLLGLALNSPNGEGNQAAEKSKYVMEIFKQRPIDFISGLKKFKIKNSCIFRYIIPRTQFIPFSEVKSVLKNIKTKIPEIDTFLQDAEAYYLAVEKGKPIKESESCPDKL